MKLNFSLCCVFDIVLLIITVNGAILSSNLASKVISDDLQKLTNHSFNMTALNSTPIQERIAIFELLQLLLGSPSTEPPEYLEPPTDCLPCKCGKANVDTRIIGGQETKRNQYPWMCLLQYGGSFYCGCTLISNKYVLTAAHCVYRFEKDKISVRLSIYDRSVRNESIVVKAKRITFHESYSTYNYDNDIALIRLAENIKFENMTQIRPACLPRLGKSYTGFNATVIGWGATDPETGQLSQTLQEVHVPVMSNDECKQTAYGKRRITENMLCAGYKEGGKDSCQGDSGGPLIVYHEEEKSFAVAGVVSWGEGCAQPNYPGVYSRVNRYLSWISAHTADSCFCDSS